MEGIRFAGDKLADLDTMYANALVKEDAGLIGKMGNVGRAVPLADAVNFGRQDTALGNAVVNTAITGANVASRYALPAGAAVLGYQGVQSLISDQQSPGAVMPQ